ncbi:MAG: hypothetical protein LBO62_07980 [Endomicrobium sp.]|jgi:hypothetical protein|nr:hypothetical protein [Endomicrobium sp.]
MKIDFKKMNLLDTASYICGRLIKKGVNVVLVGGACVSVYTDNKYLLNDFDLVCENALQELEPILNEMGFKRKGRLFYNENSDFVLDFVPPPVMIAQKRIKKTAVIKTKFGQLYLLTPTDCIKDRLAGFYFWNDPQSFEQAALVYKSQKKKIDVKDIERWAKQENAYDKCRIFLEKIKFCKGK